MLRSSLSFLSLAIATPALADAPRVATDIAPIHSLVATVMQGVGTPDLILPPGASPHGYSMRPSEAEALSQADLVIWVGAELAPWLEKSLASIGSDASQLELLDLPGTTRLPFRETPVFGKDEDAHDDHDHEEHDEHKEHDDHDHDGHEDHADHKEEDHNDHDDHAEHDDHADDHHDHDHSGTDPHAWLSPANATYWLGEIAATLSKIDPEHADIYQANANQASDELTTLVGELKSTLAPMKSVPFVVFHDAYQYFESSFDLAASGAISLGDASRPGPARIQALQQEVQENGIRCALAEPQFNPGLVATVFDGTDVETQVIDPLGTELTQGPALYTELMKGIASNLLSCAQ